MERKEIEIETGKETENHEEGIDTETEIEELDQVEIENGHIEEGEVMDRIIIIMISWIIIQPTKELVVI